MVMFVATVTDSHADKKFCVVENDIATARAGIAARLYNYVYGHPVEECQVPEIVDGHALVHMLEHGREWGDFNPTARELWAALENHFFSVSFQAI